MQEKARYTFNDERYAAVGDLVVRAALDAQARLGVLETDILNSKIHGHATIKDLEARKTLLEEDASRLGSMAVQIDPNWAAAHSENNGSPSSAETPGSRKPIERINFVSEEQKATFHERTSKFVHTMVAHGNLIEKTNNISAGTLLKEAMGIDQVTWNNFSNRLRGLGILAYERKHPHSKKIDKAYMNRERVEELIELGDLPAELADVLSKLDETEEPEQRDVVQDTIEAAKQAAETMPESMQKRMQDGLSSIRTRHTGAHVHQRARTQ